MSQRQKIGKIGETLACQYLLDKGYKILETNRRVNNFGEIDIIAVDPMAVLAFIEVKTMRMFHVKQCGNTAIQNKAIGTILPEDQITVAKYKRMARAAQICAGLPEFKKHIDEKRGWRIDVIAIILCDTSKPILRHYENVI